MKKVADTSTEQWLGGLERLLCEAEEDTADEGGDADARVSLGAELGCFTRGELGPLRLAELEARSGTEPELQRALELHRPLEPALLERISQRVLGGGAAATGVSGGMGVSGGTRELATFASQTRQSSFAPQRASRPSGPPRDESASDRVVPAQAGPARSRARLLWGLAPALAAAAALMLLLRSPSSVPLGDYQVEVAGAVAVTRGVGPSGVPAGSAQPPSLRVLPGGTLSVVLRPAVPDARAVEAFVFMEHAAERRALHASQAHAPSGALRLTLELPPFDAGTVLLVVVARPGVELPSSAAARAERGEGWQSFRFGLLSATEP